MEKAWETVEVFNDYRDLGAHLNATQRWRATTLTKRMRQTARETDRLNKVKAPYKQTNAIIRGKKWPNTLYGCELSPINESALRILRSSFASCITYTSKRRSTDLVYAMASEGTDLDPEVEIVARRAVAFRRYYTKNDTNKHKVDKIYQEYAKAKEPGIDVDDRFLKENCIAEESATPEQAKLRK